MYRYMNWWLLVHSLNKMFPVEHAFSLEQNVNEAGNKMYTPIDSDEDSRFLEKPLL